MEFTIWKNRFKKTDKQPDYRINQKDESGQWVEIGAAWKKTLAGKVDDKGLPITYLSCKLKEKDELSEADKEFIRKQKEAESKVEAVDHSEIPF